MGGGGDKVPPYETFSDDFFTADGMTPNLCDNEGLGTQPSAKCFRGTIFSSDNLAYTCILSKFSEFSRILLTSANIGCLLKKKFDIEMFL